MANVWLLLCMLPGAFFAPVIHEWVKAICSYTLGDPNLKKQGYLTLNPFKFFEPIGFIFMFVYHVGWGQPVPTSQFHYKDRRNGVILVYTIPIFANLFIGMITILLVGMFFPHIAQLANMFRGLSNDWHTIFHVILVNIVASSSLNDLIPVTLLFFAGFNISLAVFNLIPVYPMAASRLMQTLANPNTAARMNHYEKPMQFLLMIFLIFGIVSMIITPITSFFLFLMM